MNNERLCDHTLFMRSILVVRGVGQSHHIGRFTSPPETKLAIGFLCLTRRSNQPWPVCYEHKADFRKVQVC